MKYEGGAGRRDDTMTTWKYFDIYFKSKRHSHRDTIGELQRIIIMPDIF